MATELSPSLQSKVDHIIAYGGYDNAEAVLEASLNLLEAHERQLTWLRAEIAHSDEQIRRGDVIEYGPETMPRLLAEANERSRLGLPVRDAVKSPA